MKRFYAKSDPIETLNEHTKELLERFYLLQQLYQDRYLCMAKRDWTLLKLAVLYHDVGKVDIGFQNRILKALKMNLIQEGCEIHVPHNFLSILLIPYKQLGLTQEEVRLLVQVIAYHHERRYIFSKADLLKVYDNNIKPNLEQLEEHMQVEISSKCEKSAADLIEIRINPSDGALFCRYIMIKGLLHRLDHTASAHVPIELAYECSPEKYTTQFLKRREVEPRPLQRFAKNNQENHLLLMAQTGMGKTEAAMMWLGKEKGFFTLPLRTSINAMYKRLLDKDDIGFSKKDSDGEEEALGLLHSSSMDTLLDIENDRIEKLCQSKQEEEREKLEEKLEYVNNQARNYSNKLIISTIDQILKFAFLVKGFEKELATLAGARVIIDEMQAYDPKLAAVIIRALTLIDTMGGKFMIITATMPDIYIKALRYELKNSNVKLVEKKFTDDRILRHKLKIFENGLIDNLEAIIKKSKNKKTLIICNTVKRAKEVHNKLTDYVQSKLLHSQFIRRDRYKKEEELQCFEKDQQAVGIWVTTQLVEASMDIDFDILYTELSTLDSLFQRMGRCNRQGKKAVDTSNVHIFFNASGIGKKAVYHQDIYERSKEMIRKCDNQFLLESDKMNMIEKLYDNQELEGSEYKKEFMDMLEELKNLRTYDVEKGEVNAFMRQISQLQVIPRSIYNEEGLELCEKYAACKKNEYLKKRSLRKQIEQLTLGVSYYYAKNQITNIPNGPKDIYIIENTYSPKSGLDYDKRADNFN